MIHTLALTKDLVLKRDIPLEDLRSSDIEWYWVDFDCPCEKESHLLETFFHFHPLAIEDCLHFLQRPKLDYYENYNFFVLHALNENTLTAEEVDLFVGSNFIVSYHQQRSSEIDAVRQKIASAESSWLEGSVYVCYSILDKLVDNYFPAAYKLEDDIDTLESRTGDTSLKTLMEQVFQIRSNLLKFRRIVTQMRDLLYRTLNSNHLDEIKSKHVYFTDIYDHLLRLSEMIESSQAVTSEIRDSYLSINAHRMNKIMMLLTVITTIFIPLTFIVGIYGMNFKDMPELNWKYGYFIVLAVMAALAFIMFLWFKRKGWFDLD